MAINTILNEYNMLNEYEIWNLFGKCKWLTTSIVAWNLFLVSLEDRRYQKSPISKYFEISQVDKSSYETIRSKWKIPKSIEITISVTDIPDIIDIFNRICFFDALALLNCNSAISIIQPELGRSSYFTEPLSDLKNVKIQMNSEQLKRLLFWNEGEVTDRFHKELRILHNKLLDKMNDFTQARDAYRSKTKELETKFSFNIFESEENINRCITDIKKAKVEVAKNPNLKSIEENLSQITLALESAKVILNKYNHVFENVIRPIKNYGQSGIKATARWAIIGIIISLLLSFIFNVQPIRQKITNYLDTIATESLSQEGD